MSLSLQVLSPLAADFDGDTLNIMHIINSHFFARAYEVFNPRNAMYISRKDGMLNGDVLPMKDTLVNANTLNYFYSLYCFCLVSASAAYFQNS